jgi:type 1 glutamine amidotransferase
MNARTILALPIAAAVLCGAAARAADEIPAHRLRPIQEAAPDKPQVKPAKQRRVLIFISPPHIMPNDPHKGYCVPYGSAAFVAIGTKSGAYKPVISDDLAMFLPDSIRTFDAIVLNNTAGDWIKPTDADLAKGAFRKLNCDKAAAEKLLKETFLGYVHNGGGLVVIHFGIAGNRSWPEFRKLVGGTFIGHPWNEEIGVTVEDPESPLVAAFGGKDFRVADEVYEYGPPFDRGKVRVLLSLDPARTNMGVRWIHRKDNDHVLAWVTTVGKGRLFVTSFGHRMNIYTDPRTMKFYCDGIQFATGDLKAPTDPQGDKPPVRHIPGTDPAPGLEGFVSLFNGKDLTGWTGDPNIWSVQDGAVTGRTTADVKVKENNFLLWKDEVQDFELRVKFRMEGGNSGIYYRCRKRRARREKEALIGTQADFSADGRWTGEIMEYTLRGELAKCGEKVAIDEKGSREVVASLGEPKELLKKVKITEWNEYRIVARGGHVTLSINGTPMCELDDKDPKRLQRGWLGLQVHVGPPMRVQFKDVYYKKLRPAR